MSADDLPRVLFMGPTDEDSDADHPTMFRLVRYGDPRGNRPDLLGVEFRGQPDAMGAERWQGEGGHESRVRVLETTVRYLEGEVHRVAEERRDADRKWSHAFDEANRLRADAVALRDKVAMVEGEREAARADVSSVRDRATRAEADVVRLRDLLASVQRERDEVLLRAGAAEAKAAALTVQQDADDEEGRALVEREKARADRAERSAGIARQAREAVERERDALAVDSAKHAQRAADLADEVVRLKAAAPGLVNLGAKACAEAAKAVGGEPERHGTGPRCGKTWEGAVCDFRAGHGTYHASEAGAFWHEKVSDKEPQPEAGWRLIARERMRPGQPGVRVVVVVLRVEALGLDLATSRSAGGRGAP